MIHDYKKRGIFVRMKCYRFYGVFITAQEKWLNEMAMKGYRLSHTGKLLYEFEECEPGRYEYKIEYVGQQSRESVQNYKFLLESRGYRVFYKNVNLDYSIGKVQLQPWADKEAWIATNANILNRELLIIEKEIEIDVDGKDILNQSRLKYYRRMRNLYFLLLFIFIIADIIRPTLVFTIFTAITCVSFAFFQIQLMKWLKKNRS